MITMNVLRVVMAVLWLLDTVLTSIFVNLGGIELEANPLVRYIFESAGTAGFVVTKLLVLSFFWYATRQDNRPWVWWATLALNAVLLAAVVLGGLLVTSLTGV